MFGRTAENAQKFLSKGSQVAITGRLQTRKWQDKSGADRWSTEVICERMEFVGSKSTNGNGNGGSSDHGGSYGGGGGSYGGADDDIPF